MSDFPHLPLPRRISATYRFKGFPGGRQKSDKTTQNTTNRAIHGQALLSTVSTISQQWSHAIEQRKAEGLPDLPEESIIPLLFQVDPQLFTPENLYALGIEVIAENEDGYIIGAGADHFITLKRKIETFIRNAGNRDYNKPAELWRIIEGEQWRLDYILSQDLNQKWDRIRDTEILVVDVSVACDIKTPAEPSRDPEEPEEVFRERYQRWQVKKERLEGQRPVLQERRQNDFKQFAEASGAALLSGFVEDTDSFGCRLELSGLALKDIVLRYQYLFDVIEFTTLTYSDSITRQTIDFEATILPPDIDSPNICIIDSGIQEGHRLLQPAVESVFSRSYLRNVSAGGDEALSGGHGTKVAGAVLYGSQIPKSGNIAAPFWLYSAKVLDSFMNLPKYLFPPLLMKRIIQDYPQCKLFNLSIADFQACRTKHMSLWASAIDNLIASQDVLFIISTGNIFKETNSTFRPGIRDYLNNGIRYPNYLLENSARIASPAQSCFALSVGSVCINRFEDEDVISFGEATNPSSFTRIGPGMWQMIKPDIVEYGGDFIREKNANPNISQRPVTSVEVVQSNSGGGHAIGYDIGTSFATPKVTHIAGMILKQLPSASNNLVRALLVQSARLPGTRVINPRNIDLRYYGYGIPNASRATENNEQRITFVREDKIAAREAQVYTIIIPDEINRPGNDYDVLVEVCLAFTARTRRTRRRTHSYLATWADWQSSKLTETAHQFRTRISNYVEQDHQEEETIDELPEGVIPWMVRERKHWGKVKDFCRQDSSIQKDWTVFKAYNLPDEFSIAVIGHKGWEQDATKQIPYALTVSFEVLNAQIPIYESIRLENRIEVEIEL